MKVVTLGEAMIRYSTKGFTPLESATELEMRVAGAEANVAVACARLGLQATWISKLTDNPLGRFIESEIRRHGVTTEIIWTEQFRVGTYYIEFGAKPRPTRVFYDRKDSAVSHLTPEEVNWKIVRDANLFHITGITPALSASCQAVTERAMQEARSAGTLVSFDVNYRSKLWAAEEARRVLAELLPLADIIFVSLEEAAGVFKIQGDDKEIVEKFAQEFSSSSSVVVLTLGERGALARHGKELRRIGIYPVETVDPIGTGDAFAAGFLFGYLTRGQSLEQALEWGAALAALKRTMPGDIAVVTPLEVQALIQKEVLQIER